MNIHELTSELLLQLLGYANPTYFLTQRLLAGERDKIRDIARVFGKEGICRGNIFAHPELVKANWVRLDLPRRDHPLPATHLPVHVFLVHSKELDEGFVVPVEAQPSETWQIAETFGTFGGKGKTPLDSFMELLGLVEESWERVDDSVLPARWLRAFNFRLLCPVHMDLFEGESLQVPLLLAVLRAFGRCPDAEGRALLPLGNGPVFATGTVESNGHFGPVACVPKKLKGFIRELGEGHPALLTEVQIQELRSFPELLDKIQIYEVNSLEELLQLGPIREGLESLSNTYHPSLNEHLISLSETASRQIHFSTVQRLSGWVLPRIESPYYQFKFSCAMAQVLFHDGRFADAWGYLKRAWEMFNQHRSLFGVDDWARLVEMMCNRAIDAYEPALFSELVSQFGPHEFDAMTGPHRVKVFGSLCQFHRMFGNFSEAISFGRKAVALADTVYASEAGRSRNYLVHALIAAYREEKDPRADLLKEAAEVLTQANNDWAPQHDDRARANHLGFCLHLEAEIARLSGNPFLSPVSPYPEGDWSHPWLFTLLSCARNRQHDESLRRQFLSDLLQRSQEKVEKEGQKSLFGLFDAIYRLCDAIFNQKNPRTPQNDLDKWLLERKEEGFPGWRDYLMPFIERDMDVLDVERLCNAIRYH